MFCEPFHKQLNDAFSHDLPDEHVNRSIKWHPMPSLRRM
jgi:hypothetical protein